MECVRLSDVVAGVELALPGMGTMSVTQGAYGSRGNLELVVPHAGSGATVCWFNSDPPGGPVAEPAIPAATWSVGLQVATGVVSAVAIHQARSGPHFLELVVSGTAGLHRWTWSPGPGFEQTDTWTEEVGLPFVTETDTDLVLGQASSRGVVRMRASLVSYPALQDWHVERLEVAGDPVAVAADRTGGVLAALRLNGDLRLVRWRADGSVDVEPTGVSASAAVALAVDPEVLLVAEPTAAEEGVDGLACAWSQMGEEHTLEIIVRSAGSLRHCRLAM